MSYILTQISQAIKNTERVNLFLNGKFWLGLSKNNLVTLKLFKGQQLSDEEKREIEKTAYDSNLISKAMNFLQVRPRSCGEVRDYLVLRKGVSKDDAENVIAYLEEREFLSDEKFAQWYIEYKLSVGVNGVNKIKMELMQKKVNMKTIIEVLEKVYANDEFKDDQLQKIKEYGEKIIKTIKAKDSYELKSKLVQRLMARGFKYDEIKKVIVDIITHGNNTL